MLDAIIRFLMALFGQAPPSPAGPVTPATTGDSPSPVVLQSARNAPFSATISAPALPTGTIQTPAPWNGRPLGVPWANVTRWQREIDAALARFPKVREYLGADVYRFFWAVFAIEAGGHQVYPPGDPRGAGKVVTGPDFSPQDGPGLGVMQVKRIHQWLAPDADIETAAGNILLGTALLNQWFPQVGGDWRRVIAEKYHPGTAPNGTTQSTYVTAVAGIMAEAVAATPSEVPAPTVEDTGEALAAAARRQLGKRYVHATAGPETFDCSGLVAFLVQQVTGKTITRSSYDQIKLGKAVPNDKIALGDLLFWDTERNGSAGHVAISSGMGKAISAFNASRGVIEHGIEATTVGGTFLGARRLAGQVVVADPKGPAPRIENIRDAATQAKYGLTAAQATALTEKCYPGRRGQRPEVIVLHIQGGYTGGSLRHWLGVQASATFMANRDGTLVKVISETASPWTNGDNRSPDAQARGLMARFGNDLNVVALTIEAEGDNDDPLTPAQFAAILWQVRDWQERYPWITNDRILGHFQINATQRSFCGRYKDRIIAALTGGPVPAPGVTYAPLRPVSAAWTGDDLTTASGTFYALRRRFTAVRAGVPVRQFAAASAAEVRAPLAKGEVIDSDYLVQAGDGDWYVVTKSGARVPAAGLTPIVTMAAA